MVHSMTPFIKEEASVYTYMYLSGNEEEVQRDHEARITVNTREE